jgi:hypothetical protein
MAVLALVVSVCSAQVVKSTTANQSDALGIINKNTNTVTVAVNGNGSNIVVTIDGNVNTILTGASVQSAVAASIVACTNAAGYRPLSVNAECSLPADIFSNNLVNTTNTITKQAPAYLLWNTATCLHSDLYFASNKYNPGYGGCLLGTVIGCPVGTGNVTLSVYIGGTLSAEQVITSPVYVNPATLVFGGTNAATNTMGVVDDVNINLPLNIRCTVSQAVLIRAARATTMTAPVLGAITE